jgi:hypothetical protein
MREQARGSHCYVESEFAPMEACTVGDMTKTLGTQNRSFCRLA